VATETEQNLVRHRNLVRRMVSQLAKSVSWVAQPQPALE